MYCCHNNYKNIKIFCIINFIILISIIIFLIITVLNNSENNKSILVAIAKSEDNTQIGNAIINFSENQIIEGNALSHEEGQSQININKDGIYQISYQLEGVDNGTSTNFNFNSILIVNNNPLNDTLNEGAVLNEEIVNNRYTLTSTVILKLNEGDILQLGALSLENITYPSARIDIEKIN